MLRGKKQQKIYNYIHKDSSHCNFTTAVLLCRKCGVEREARGRGRQLQLTPLSGN
jgi:hypothetical protein